MSNRTVVALSLLVLSLTACPKKPDAAADMSAAVTLDSGLAERAKLYGVVAGLRQ